MFNVYCLTAILIFCCIDSYFICFQLVSRTRCSTLVLSSEYRKNISYRSQQLLQHQILHLSGRIEHGKSGESLLETSFSQECALSRLFRSLFSFRVVPAFPLALLPETAPAGRAEDVLQAFGEYTMGAGLPFYFVGWFSRDFPRIFHRRSAAAAFRCASLHRDCADDNDDGYYFAVILRQEALAAMIWKTGQRFSRGWCCCCGTGIRWGAVGTPWEDLCNLRTTSSLRWRNFSFLSFNCF